MTNTTSKSPLSVTPKEKWVIKVSLSVVENEKFPLLDMPRPPRTSSREAEQPCVTFAPSKPRLPASPLASRSLSSTAHNGNFEDFLPRGGHVGQLSHRQWQYLKLVGKNKGPSQLCFSRSLSPFLRNILSSLCGFSGILIQLSFSTFSDIFIPSI